MTRATPAEEFPQGYEAEPTPHQAAFDAVRQAVELHDPTSPYEPQEIIGQRQVNGHELLVVKEQTDTVLPDVKVRDVLNRMPLEQALQVSSILGLQGETSTNQTVTLSYAKACFQIGHDAEPHYAPAMTTVLLTDESPGLESTKSYSLGIDSRAAKPVTSSIYYQTATMPIASKLPRTFIQAEESDIALAMAFLPTMGQEMTENDGDAGYALRQELRERSGLELLSRDVSEAEMMAMSLIAQHLTD